MAISEQRMVLLEGVFKIIFEELDRIWLTRIKRWPSESRWNMLDIIFMLYLFKCRIWLLILVTLSSFGFGSVSYFDDWYFDRTVRASTIYAMLFWNAIFIF